MTKKMPRLRNGAPPSGEAKQFWNMQPVSEDEGEIKLYGEIYGKAPVDWWTGEPEPGLYVTPEGFLDDLAQVRDKAKITVRINSNGGDLYTGIAIHNALKSLPGRVTTVVEGIAASAASLIACASDETLVYPGSIVMVHGVGGELWGYFKIQDLKLLIKGFDAAERAAAAIYSAKTGAGVDALRSMMEKETWMTGREAVEKGFANTVLDGPGPEMRMVGNDILMVNGVSHNVRGLHIPPSFHIPGLTSTPIEKSSDPKEVQPLKTENKAAPATAATRADVIQSTADLERDYPVLVAQLRSDAAQAERQRIQEIEDISREMRPEMVADAKYINPITAAELAVKALRDNAALAAAYAANARADFAASGAAQVGTAPEGPPVLENKADEPRSMFYTIAHKFDRSVQRKDEN